MCLRIHQFYYQRVRAFCKNGFFFTLFLMMGNVNFSFWELGCVGIMWWKICALLIYVLGFCFVCCCLLNWMWLFWVGCRASEKCQKEKRKTINGDDLLWAMATLGFEDYIEPLKVYLARYREVISLSFFPQLVNVCIWMIQIQCYVLKWMD